MEKTINSLTKSLSKRQLESIRYASLDSMKSILLAYAVSKGLHTDIEYQNATFSITVRSMGQRVSTFGPKPFGQCPEW